MMTKRFFAFAAAVGLAGTAFTASAEPPPLQYEGISAATTLADLKARFADQVKMEEGADALGHRHVTAFVRFEPSLLGRASSLDYDEVANEMRVIRLFFAIPGSAHPGDEINPSCGTLLDPLRHSFGREPNVGQSNEENLHHVTHIWTQGAQTMTLDCANLPKEPLTIDRLYFECRGVCH